VRPLSRCLRWTRPPSGRIRRGRPPFKRSLPALPVLALTLLTSVGAAQPPPSFKTPEDVSAFVQTYYQRPRPELVGGLIEAFYSTGLAERANAAAPFIGFFSEVFAANPAGVPEWQALGAKRGGSVRDVLERAVAFSKAGGVTTIGGHSPSTNDLFWGAFFASGRPEFLQKLADQLRYFRERDDLMLFMAGATAKWSLASNAESHPLVRSTLEGPTLVADQVTRDIIRELLTQGSVRVKQEIAGIVERQREAGKWPYRPNPR
jgi:hypothetical protein